ncbi:head-tail connector protein [Prevotella koreensis]
MGIKNPSHFNKKIKNHTMYLQLYQIKKHLNIDDSFHEDDEYLVDLAKVAENAVQKHIDMDLQLLEDKDGTIPMPINQAMLLMIGTFYAKRESIAFANSTEVPLAYNYLLSLYKNYNGPHEGTRNI